MHTAETKRVVVVMLRGAAQGLTLLDIDGGRGQNPTVSSLVIPLRSLFITDRWSNCHLCTPNHPPSYPRRTHTCARRTEATRGGGE